MARTLIGQLILRLKSEGEGEARKLGSALDRLEAKARRLNGTNWGAGFQRNLDKLRLAPAQIQQVEQSWLRLQNTLAGKPGAAKRVATSTWQSNWSAALAAQKLQLENHHKAIEEMTRRHGRRVGNLMRTGFYLAGGGMGAYAGANAARGGLKATSERARTEYRASLGGIAPEELVKMQEEAQRLSGKYGSVDSTDILELNRTAFALMGGNGDQARKLMEPLVKAFVADVTAVGVDAAGENLSRALKAVDNLNRNQNADGTVGGVDRIGAILEGATKAKQVEGRDIDIGEYLEFARKTKVAKYGLSDDFLTNYLPALGQDVGFGGLGDGLAGAYQNFVTPSGGGTQGQYVKRQKAMGLRDKNNSIIGRDLFVSNPFEWATTVLKPQLAKQGVDVENTGALSEAIKKLMSNSRAAAVITGFIESEPNIRKNMEMYQGSTGFGDVENARFKDPFAALESLMVSLRNLSAEAVPIETIAAGLSGMATGVNQLAGAMKDNPALTWLGIGAAGAGAAAGGKWAVGKMADMFGLRASALALDGSAVALTRAAVALGGAGMVGDLPGGGKKGGLKGLLTGGTWPIMLAALAAGLGAKSIEGLSADYAAETRKRQPALPFQGFGVRHNGDPTRDPRTGAFLEGGFHRLDNRGAPRPGEAVSIDPNIAAEAARIGQQVKASLSVEAKPNVDMSGLAAARDMAQHVLNLLNQIGTAAVTANANAEGQMRRVQTDYGVAP